MSTYTPTLLKIGTALDDIGLNLGLIRLDHETMGEYRNRLVYEAKRRASSTEISFVESVGKRLGILPTNLWHLELVDGYDDPRVIVTSNYLRIYSDFANDVIDTELNFNERTGGSAGYFIRDIDVGLGLSSVVVATQLPDYSAWEFERSTLLLYGSNLRSNSRLLPQTTLLKLDHTNLVTFITQAPEVFRTLQPDTSTLDNDGDYAIDMTNGVIWTVLPMRGIAQYSYTEWPFILKGTLTRAFPYNDVDMASREKSTLISDSTGEEEHVLLNSFGTNIANDVYNVHPTGWGK